MLLVRFAAILLACLKFFVRQTTVLISFLTHERLLPSGPQLEGYGWWRNNLVIGSRAFAARWERFATTKLFSQLRDGLFTAYAPRTKAQDARLVTDAMGYGKIFLYRDGEEWAASSSWYELFLYLKKHGKTLTPNEPVLSHLQGVQDFNQQLFSFQTSVREIELVPQWQQLVIGSEKGAFSLVPSETYASYVAEAADSSYAAQLQRWYSDWRGRLQTLADSQRRILVDVTGGVDSRVGFGLFVDNWQRFAHAPRLRFRTSPNVPGRRTLDADQRIAALLAKLFGVEIGTDYFKVPRGAKRRGPADAWRYFAYAQLGVYSTLNLNPHTGVSDDSIRFAGGGGEIYRGVYAAIAEENELRAFAKRRLHTQTSRLNANRAVDDFVASIRSAPFELRDNDNLLRTHYILFRNRCHFGGNMLNQAYLYPTSDLGLALSCLRQRNESPHTNPILDMLYALDPALALLPFDKPNKSFSLEEIEAITQVDKKAPTTASGEVWFDGSEEESTPQHFLSLYPNRWESLSQPIDVFVSVAAEAVDFVEQTRPRPLSAKRRRSLRHSLARLRQKRQLGDRSTTIPLLGAILLHNVYGA